MSQNTNDSKVNYSEGMPTLKKIIYDIDTFEEKGVIGFTRRNVYKELEIPREDYLNTSNIIKYQKYGIDIMQSSAKEVVDSLRENEDDVEYKLVHSELGFSLYEGKKVYKHYKGIGIDSTYCGNIKIKPKGSREEWLTMFNKEVLGNSNLEFICCVALSSVIVAYIGESMGLDTSIFHMVGNSTSGKSTGSKLAISMFGYPDVKKNGLFSTYNSTDNALIKQMIGIRGMPIALDELSMSGSKNQSSFVYKVANGTDKGRLNQDSTMKKKESWLGTVISNGEKSLINSCNKNAGIQNRVIEASNISWTSSAKNAEAITEVILANYGHIGVEFAKYVMKIGETKIKKYYSKSIDILSNIMESNKVVDNFTKRRVNKYASIHLAGRLFNKMLNIELDMKNIEALMVEIEKESILNRNFDLVAIEKIKSYVDINNSKFISTSHTPVGDSWGKLTNKKDYIELEMNLMKFESMVSELGFEDKNIVLSELKDKGILLCDKDRYTRKRKNSSGIKVQVIVINLSK